MTVRTLVPILLLAAAACADTEHPDEHNDNEIITTVELTFRPDAGGDALVFTWADAENTGTPVIDPVSLPAGTAFALGVRFLDALSSPPDDITEEIEEEDTQHQVFFTGTGVEGPAGAGATPVLTHAYADEDALGQPLGLENRIDTLTAGTGTLIVTLQHLPPVDGVPVKDDGLAAEVASGGLGALPGDADASVTFQVEVK